MQGNPLFVPRVEAVPPASAPHPRSPPAADTAFSSAQFAALAELNQALECELLHCQEKLNLVCAISARVATLRSVDDIESALLGDLGTLLDADALFLDRSGCCLRVSLGTTSAGSAPGAAQVRAALAPYVEAARVGRRVIAVPDCSALGGARVLLGRLPRLESEVGVVLALRGSTRAAFDATDVLAAEAVLAYGAETLSNVAMQRHLHRTTLETVYVLVNAIDAKDNYTSDHSERVGALARATGQLLGLPQEQLQTLEWAALLHDIGKIGIPEHILNKPGKLDPQEWALMQRHPVIGHEILKPVTNFEPFLNAVLYHHENHDGSGYPEGIAGRDVPLEARIVHVVDIFDALTTDRPYRRAFSREQALSMMKRDAGTVSDPDITAALLHVVRSGALFTSGDFGHLHASGSSSSS